jgi:NusA-like KH domain protein
MLPMVELTGDDLNIFSNFERITRVMPSDYLATETSVIFLVSQDSLGKAIGKQATNIEKLKAVFRKRVIIVADSSDVEGFVRNFFGNITIHSVEIRDVMGEQAIMLTIDEKDRGIAIGRDGERIKAAKAFLKKKFNATVHLRTRRAAF